MSVAEIDLDHAWERLSSEATAVLIDVRTEAEWSFVGIPDLSTINKPVKLVEWTTFPSGAPNADFVAQASDGLDPSQPLLMLCRSGARSRAAGSALAAAGFTDVSNVSAGFEGDVGPDNHRHGGWKEALPWIQQ